jgi:hypothetical protein
LKPCSIGTRSIEFTSTITSTCSASILSAGLFTDRCGSRGLSF